MGEGEMVVDRVVWTRMSGRVSVPGCVDCGWVTYFCCCWAIVRGSACVFDALWAESELYWWNLKIICPLFKRSCCKHGSNAVWKMFDRCFSLILEWYWIILVHMHEISLADYLTRNINWFVIIADMCLWCQRSCYLLLLVHSCQIGCCCYSKLS